MRHIGVVLLLLATAAVGALSYVTGKTTFLQFNKPLSRLFLILLIILFANIITRLGVWGLQRYSKQKDKGDIKQITSVYRYAVWIVLLFIILALLYAVLGPIITSIGLLAAGVTLALQRPILNLAGWFTIVAKRPYKIGDRVDIGTMGGFVHEISLMHTHLSLVDKEELTGKVLYVPNEQALTQPIANYTKGSPLVWDSVRVKVPVTANIKEAEKKLAACVKDVVGKEMEAAAVKWNTDITIQTRAAIEYTGLQPSVEITMRYLSNVKTLTVVKTEITHQIIRQFRKEFTGK